MKKRLLSLFCVLALCLGLLPTTAWAADGESVTYLTWDESTRTSIQATCSEYTALSNESISTTWGAGWYVLDADKEFSARITLQGDVYLILMDGYTLTAIGGIGLSSGSSLTIYGQENDTGTLIATAAEGDAGIGGNGYKGADASGDITICGGTVVATGGTEGGAGIGSGRDDRTNIEITIYGGIVKATGGTDAAGIGSSPGGSIDYITLAGGTIEAAHGEVKRQDIESMYNGEEDAPYDVGPGWKGSMKARMSFVAGSGGFDDDKGEPVLQSGSSNGTTYSRYVVDISGGNLYTTGGGNALTTENPYNGNYGELDSDSKAVYCAVADLGAAYAGESVSGTITVNGEEYLYNFNGVRADANGKLHLYLFAGEAALSVDGIDFEYTGTIDADNHTLQPTLGGTIYFNETTPYQDKLTVNTDTVTPDSYRDNLTYTWYRCDDSTGANATLIEGANTSTYTLTDKDQGKYIKVEVSAAGFEGNPLSTVSHKVGSDTAANILRITGATLDTKAYDGTGDWDVQNVSFDAATLTMGEDYTATASIVGTNYNAGGFKKVTVTVTLLNSAYTFEGDETEATYTLTGQTVVPATLTVASATALNRNVDDTTTVQITGVTLTGVIGSEDVSVDTTGLTGELSGSTAGSYDTVRFTQDLTLTGADASNYTLTQPTEAVTLDPAVILKGAVVDQDSNGVYQIQTEDDLFWFAALVNGTLTDGTDQDLDASAVLCSDIVISSDRTWIPIGDYSANTRNKYAGTFDGAGHTIDGLKADGGSAQGFVGYMDGGTIKNCTFNGTVTSSGSAGGICGSNSNSGTIKNCTSYGKVTSSKGNTGGICGYNSSTVTGCTNNAAVEGYFYFGGICGFNTGTITNCINKGEVKLTASQGRYMGGICGYSTNTITNCISSGKINGTCAAGICAWNSTTGTVTNCYWLTSSIGGTGVYDNDGTQGKVESKTATEFASGEVCWLLNNSSSESPVWYQNVDSGTKDNYPVLDSSHGVVYRIERDSDVFYSNDPEGKLSIADATVSLSGDSFTYNGQSQKPEVTVKLDGKELTTNDYDVQFSGDTTNAGTVTVTVTGKGSYSGKANQTPTYTINKATPTLVWRNTSQALPYTGNPAAITAPTVTLVNGEIYSGEISYQYKAEGTDDYTNGLPIDAGTYTVMASIAAQGNYTAASGELTLTIKKAAASGTVTAVADLTYNGSAQALVTEGNVTGGTMQYRLGENGDYSATVPSATNAGKYTVYYYVKGDTEHTDSTPASVEVTIAQMPVELTWSDTAFTYDGSAKCPTATVSNKANTADDVTVTVTGGQTNASDTAYTATATELTGAAAGNYTLIGCQNISQQFTIAKANPNVNAPDNLTATYGDTLDDVTLPEGWAWDAPNTSVGNVGDNTFAAIFTPSDTDNYNTVTKNLTVAVFAKDITGAAITLGDALTYTGQEQTQQIASVIVDDLTVTTYEISGNTGTDADTYTLTVTGTGNFTGTATKEWTIAKANYNGATDVSGTVLANWPDKVTLPAIPAGASYGAASTTDDLTGLSIEGSVLSYTGGSGITEGQAYKITVPVNGGNNYENYNITITLTGTDKTRLEITGVTAQNGTYSGQTQSGYTGTPSAQGYTGDFTVTYNTTDGKAPTNAGNYAVTIAIPDSDPRYVGRIVLEFTIAKKALTVSAPSPSVYVGDSAPELALTYTGLVDGDSVTPSQEPDFTITKSDNTVIDLEDAVKTVGTYTITWSNANQDFSGADNYAITLTTTGTLTVSNRSSGGTTTYPVQVEENSQNGGVQVSPKNAVPGTLVTVTPQPAPGYELATLSVLDQYGNEVDVNPLGNGNYSFKMPRSRVKVEATFYCTGSELCPTHHLADVLVKAWYHDAVDYVVEHGIMTGTSATTFDPNGTLSRAMVAQILYNLEGQPTVTGESTFTDVSGHWAIDAITWAQKTGVVDGYEDNTFRPENNVTRQEFAQMMYNYAAYKDYDLSAKGDLSQFTDGDSVQEWAVTAMSWANGNALINGHDDGTLEPGGTTTRAQAASILMRFDQNLVEN